MEYSSEVVKLVERLLKELLFGLEMEVGRLHEAFDGHEVDVGINSAWAISRAGMMLQQGGGRSAQISKKSTVRKACAAAASSKQLHQRNPYSSMAAFPRRPASPCLHLLILLSLCCGAAPTAGAGKSTIFFDTLFRSRYTYDVFSSPVPAPLGSVPGRSTGEVRITDGHSVNYNGFFPADPSRLLSLLSATPPLHDDDAQQLRVEALVYVSERNGTSNIYLDAYPSAPAGSGGRVHRPLLRPDGDGRVSMKDRPSVVGDSLIYVSTHEDSGVPRVSWAAVYSTHLPTGETRRLSPPGVPDLSPAVSPSGEWTAVASWGERAWTKEIQDLNTSIYVFRTRDGSGRRKVVDHGSWPTWADESTLFFHRKCDDGWWSVFRAVLGEGPFEASVERVTLPGFHAFTPAAGKGFVAMGTRRNTSEFRHVELLDLARNTFVELTRPISADHHHYNPFVSPDSGRIGYHRCRGGGLLILESLRSPIPDVSLFRIDGSFPSISPDGSRIAFSTLPGLYVMNSDGSGRRQILPDFAFPTAWDPKRKGVLYTSLGHVFKSPTTEVDVVSIALRDEGEEVGGGGRADPTTSTDPVIKKLTADGSNNAFPSPSPDGKWLVFRSGRSGHKNLYIMDAVEGEQAGLRRLTNGPWIDTMCTWSPDGEWIAFSSNMGQPDAWSFSLYLIHPNGTGLRTLFRSGTNGQANHPAFSPDSKRVVFSTDYSGVSAEPVANAHNALPHGEMYVVGIDGNGLQRLTHNAYEDGTVLWSPFYMEPRDVAEEQPPCQFDDCYWLQPPGNSSSSNSASGGPQCGS
ncbi:hypothetical protein Taro_005647 [Colocasia esculenta]|uniref:Uncharacterized protein n=1 Tax=Colocasia esculenta TaxID=4460 RepID=A0A843TV73_COLES|nr:hypothetical protein [Colocasia esculenta]